MLGVAAIWTPDGNASVKFRPFNVVEPLGLVSVKVSVEVLLTPIVLAEKALVKVGWSSTVRVSVAVSLPVGVSVELMAPVVFTFEPDVVAVTSTVIVQLAPPAKP